MNVSIHQDAITLIQVKQEVGDLVTIQLDVVDYALLLSSKNIRDLSLRLIDFYSQELYMSNFPTEAFFLTADPKVQELWLKVPEYEVQVSTDKHVEIFSDGTRILQLPFEYMRLRDVFQDEIETAHIDPEFAICLTSISNLAETTLTVPEEKSDTLSVQSDAVALIAVDDEINY